MLSSMIIWWYAVQQSTNRAHNESQIAKLTTASYRKKPRKFNFAEFVNQKLVYRNIKAEHIGLHNNI